MNRMLSPVLAVATLATISAPVHATSLQCSGFNQISGYAGHNPPATAVVTHYSGAWFVRYILQSGMTVDGQRSLA